MTDAMQIKEKILSLIRINGPSLPVFIARETGLSILFSSAFLSELVSDKKIRISDMRVGSSPLYFIPGQEPMLENFSQYLKNKEKEAYIMLKENKFLNDRELEPAIRVALRQMRDFAIPFQRNNELLWRYFIINESELKIQDIIPEEKEIIEEIKIGEKPEESIIEEEVIIKAPEKIDEIEDKKEVKKHEKRESKKPPKKSTSPKKTKNDNNKFFNKVKEYLSDKKVDIKDIEEIGVNRIIFKAKDKEEYLIIAYNKKKITEQDIINSYKKSQEFDLPYKILLLGEPLKRLDNLINAVKDLKSIEKVE